MGGMGGSIASQSAQATGRGISMGWQTGSGIAHAQYNAEAMRMQADSLRQQSNVQAYMIRNSYSKQYQQLLEQQTAQQSMNRAIALKRGITGASAAEVLGSYAAKGQKNLDQLYYNAAMQTAQSAVQYGDKINALEEKARQYDWQATQILIGGIINLATGYFDQAVQDGGTQVDPTAQFDMQKAQAEQPAQFSEQDLNNAMYGNQSGGMDMGSYMNFGMPSFGYGG